MTIENAHSWQIGPIVGPGAARFGVFEASVNSVVHSFSVGADPLTLGGDRLGSGVGNKFQNPRDPEDSRYLQDWEWDLGSFSKSGIWDSISKSWIRDWDLGFIFRIWDLPTPDFAPAAHSYTKVLSSQRLKLCPGRPPTTITRFGAMFTMQL